MKTKALDRRINYITFLSVVSSVSVVALHTNGVYWRFSSTERYWITAGIIECLLYYAVPVFFMITGATLLDFFERYGVLEFYKKRIAKSFIPYIFWSLVGGVLFNCFVLRTLKPTELSLKYIVDGLLTGGLVSVYWFFIPLFAVYIVLPLIAAVEQEKKTIVYMIIAITWFIFNSLIPFLKNVFHLWIPTSFTIPVGGNYVFYLLVGYLLDRNKIEKPWEIIIYIQGVIGLLLHFFGTYALSIEAGEIISTYKGYLNVPCIMYSVSVFVFFKQFYNRLKVPGFIMYIVGVVSKYTFAIYLLHWHVIQIVIRLFKINVQSIIYRLFSPIPIVALIICIVFLLRKTKVFKLVLPS